MSGEETKVTIDVPYVAHLARVHLTDEEVAKFQAQLDQIVGYVNQIRELDVADVQPTAHPIPVQNVFREDAQRPGLDRAEVLANAPARHNDQFSVPKIVE